ncbi:MAG: hypothetical protein H0W88_10825 [Parachlamydiaceae bacterium]|nr:hypothetical protein [Parachlamydiaceae bacterium]
MDITNISNFVNPSSNPFALPRKPSSSLPSLMKDSIIQLNLDRLKESKKELVEEKKRLKLRITQLGRDVESLRGEIEKNKGNDSLVKGYQNAIDEILNDTIPSLKRTIATIKEDILDLNLEIAIFEKLLLESPAQKEGQFNFDHFSRKILKELKIQAERELKRDEESLAGERLRLTNLMKIVQPTVQNIDDIESTKYIIALYEDIVAGHKLYIEEITIEINERHPSRKIGPGNDNESVALEKSLKSKFRKLSKIHNRT